MTLSECSYCGGVSPSMGPWHDEECDRYRDEPPRLTNPAYWTHL